MAHRKRLDSISRSAAIAEQLQSFRPNSDRRRLRGLTSGRSIRNGFKAELGSSLAGR